MRKSASHRIRVILATLPLRRASETATIFRRGRYSLFKSLVPQLRGGADLSPHALCPPDVPFLRAAAGRQLRIGSSGVLERGDGVRTEISAGNRSGGSH